MKRRHTLQIASTALAIGFGQACEPRTAVDQDADPDLNDAQARLVEESSVVLADPSTGYLNGVDGATFLGDKIVVAEAGEYRIVAFSVDGELLWRAGRHGSGPEEFEDMSGIATVGDHVLVFDSYRRRISKFDSNGNLTSTTEVNIDADIIEQFPFAGDGVFLSDGRIAIQLIEFPELTIEFPRIEHDPDVFALFDDSGNFTKYTNKILGSEYYKGPTKRGGFVSGSLTYGKRTGVVAVGSQLVVSEGADWSLRYIDVDSDEESVWTPSVQRLLRQVTQSMRDAAALETEEFPSLKGMLDFLPTHLSPYGWMGVRPVEPLVTSLNGDVWGALSVQPGEGSRWNVISDEGSYEVSSQKPRELLALGRGRVLTKRYNDLDVETIEVLAICYNQQSEPNNDPTLSEKGRNMCR